MRGDPQTSPWTWEADDYLGRVLSISVPFDTNTGAILDGIVVHRDVGCLWTRILWDDPTNPQKAKLSPSVAEGDTTFTAKQLRQATGITTYTGLTSVQITAEQ